MGTYRDKRRYSLNELADFIAQVNNDGERDVTAWEFWHWFDKLNKPQKNEKK